MYFRGRRDRGERGGHGRFSGGLPFRGVLPIAVLGLIKDKPAHGGEIYQSLQERFGIDAARPVIYMLLRRLERTGLMVSSWDISESGPAKRKYTITEDGLEYLNRGLEELKKMAGFITQLTADKA